MSADIIQFMPRPKHHREPAGFAANAFRPAARPEDLTMDHADTSPCEYVRPDRGEAQLPDG